MEQGKDSPIVNENANPKEPEFSMKVFWVFDQEMFLACTFASIWWALISCVIYVGILLFGSIWITQTDFRLFFAIGIASAIVITWVGIFAYSILQRTLFIARQADEISRQIYHLHHDLRSSRANER